MSVYIRQNAVSIVFKTGEPWTILSQIEQSIKSKIERYGTPLKEWNIDIQYGVKTGLNEAFIIPLNVKNKLISEDPKSAEIIRPILRGRDIEKDSIHFSDLYLIALFPSKNYDIEEFPAIKNWLINGEWVQIKTKNNPPTPIGSGKMRLMQSGSTVEFASAGRCRSRRSRGDGRAGTTRSARPRGRTAAGAPVDRCVDRVAS